MSEGNPQRSHPEGRRSVLRLALSLVSPRIDATATQIEEAVDNADTALRRISRNLELATHVVAPQSRKDFIRSLAQLAGSGIHPTGQVAPTNENNYQDEAISIDQSLDYEESEPETITLFERNPAKPEADEDWYREKPIFDH